MDFLAPLLPKAEGILPYYLIIISITSIGNSIQTYLTLHFSRRVYNGRFVRNHRLPPPSDKYNPDDSTDKLVPAPFNPGASDQMTPLAGRLFGTWTVLASVVRFYAAYNLHIGPVYDMTIWTYIIAMAHFSSELLIFKSMTFGPPQMGPFIVATLALIWMPLVRDSYVTIV